MNILENAFVMKDFMMIKKANVYLLKKRSYYFFILIFIVSFAFEIQDLIALHVQFKNFSNFQMILAFLELVNAKINIILIFLHFSVINAKLLFA